MPLYEYTCRDCNRDHELLIRGSEEPVCPSCGGRHLDKQLSVPAAHSHGGNESLPMCRPMPSGGCGLPQCGTGGCMGLE